MLMVIPTTDTDTSKIVKFGFISYYTTQSGMSIQKYAPVSVSLKLLTANRTRKKCALERLHSFSNWKNRTFSGIGMTAKNVGICGIHSVLLLNRQNQSRSVLLGRMLGILKHVIIARIVITSGEMSSRL